jgi:hypothetical protein
MRAIQVLLLIWRIETKISSDGMSQPVISKGGMHKLFWCVDTQAISLKGAR